MENETTKVIKLHKGHELTKDLVTSLIGAEAPEDMGEPDSEGEMLQVIFEIED